MANGATVDIKSALFDVYPRMHVTPIFAKGVYVYDNKHRKYLDLYGGHGVISIGHGDPNYLYMLKKQLTNLGYYSNSVNIPLQEVLAGKLARVSGYPNHQLFLCNSGAEANENALKLASFHNGKKKVIAFKGSFHGRTSAALNVTDNLNLSAPINRNNFEVLFVKLNDNVQLKAAFNSHNISAVIIEGIQGVGGLEQPSKAFFYLISKYCKKQNALLIVDEVQSGYGRTGLFFAHQHMQIQADIITMAKGMGNGFPIGGVLVHPKIKAKYGMLGSTFGGNHLACTAGIAVLDTLRNNSLLDNVQIVNEYLISELKAIPAIIQVKGKGLMLGIEFDFPVAEIRQKLLTHYKIITGASANRNLLRILPPLCITTTEIHDFVLALKDIFKTS